MSCKYGLLAALLLIVHLAAQAESTASGEEALGLLTKYLRIDTTNPPGNEDRAVAWLAALFEREGIHYQTAESAPHRGNIWARLNGGDEPALVLLHHMDVVPADPDFWAEPPLSGVVRDGKLYGRGALDTKGLGILQLQAFLELARSGKPLKRDVVYLATADEEAGGEFGAGYLVAQHPEIFSNAGFLINEGGSGTIRNEREVFSVEVTQKTPLWLRLEATGQPSHGSRPAAHTSVSHLLRALERIQATHWRRAVLPTVRISLDKTRELLPVLLRDRIDDLDAAVQDPEFMARLQLTEPAIAAALANTCAITRLEGSDKINVVPPQAAAELDCRLLPDQDPNEFMHDLQLIINDPGISVERLLGFAPATSSIDTPLYRTIEAVLARHYPNAIITPAMSVGFTDSHYFRDIGIVSYGFSPLIVPLVEFKGVHGHNERVDVEAFSNAVELMSEVVHRFALD